MARIKVVLDGSSAAWMDVFKNSPEIRAGLNSYTAQAAAKNTGRLKGVKGAKSDQRFAAVIDVADKTMLGKVVPIGGAANVAKKAGLPTW